MKTTIQAYSLLTALALLAQPVTAWDGFGHMAVASVAYRSLDQPTRDRVNALLALNPYFKEKTEWPASIPAGTSAADRSRLICMLAATWPDAIKEDTNYHNDTAGGPEASRNTGYDDFNRHKFWHFVDLPFSQDGTGTTLFKTAVPNAQTRIADFRSVLNSNAPDDRKSYDLVWLLHIVGDVHQPLHCATRLSKGHPQGDIGGNAVPFCTVSAPTCNSELHAFWDNSLGTEKAVTPADKFAAGLVPPSVTAADIADAKKWIDESFALAQSSVYVKPPLDMGNPPFRATANYTTNATTIAKKRVAIAGARLAKILQAELK